MKKVFYLTLIILSAVLSTNCSHKVLTGAQVKFEMLSEGMDTSTMGRSFITHAFKDGRQAVGMDLMNGMMKTRILSDEANPQGSRMYLEAYGLKYLVTDLTDEFIKEGINLGNIANTVEVKYDKKDTKEILGYKCYKAELKLGSGELNTCYITEKIKHPKGEISAIGESLKGYPLELIMKDESDVEIRLVAVEVLDKEYEGIFDDADGYEEMTYEEFQKMTQ